MLFTNYLVNLKLYEIFVEWWKKPGKNDGIEQYVIPKILPQNKNKFIYCVRF